jgi:hypothetical protein
MYTVDFNTNNKIQSRRDTIETIYQNETGFKVIPKERQVFTLCNQAWDAEVGSIKVGSDYHQFTEGSGLCTPNQYHGVDLDESLIEINKNITEANWYYGNIVNILETVSIEPWFNPAIVYYDTMSLPENTVDDFYNILYTLISNPNPIKDCLIVYNIVTRRAPFHFKSVQDIVNALNGDERKIYLTNVRNSNAYEYTKGAGDKTKMCTVCFMT